jgi:GT2 family glycosyltransferase
MKLGVVIPTNRGADNVDRLLRSFERGERIPDEIVIVDNGAITSDYNYDGILPNVNVVSLGARHNLSAARNAGAKLISADILMLVDDDNVADRSLCSRLMKVFEGDPQVHAAGPLMRYLGSGKIWCAGIQRTSLTGRTLYIGQGEDYWDESWPNYSCELPNCIALRRDAFNAIGGFDSHLFPIHFEDADFAARLMEKFGSGFLIEPQAVVYHDTGDQMTVGSALLRSMERGGCARVRGTSRKPDSLLWMS